MLTREQTCGHQGGKGRNGMKSETWSGEGSGNPLWYSCLETPMDGGAR